ncbi:helix-turn-helix domain-containing protein [Coprobacillus cateniformis]|uniref:helix-turn-helix domain-containing protein n=1 Tax=Coprobacillus cateniformis TaxID=100884 RepID=UPI000E44390A|nr:helix-turn-helix domain-containing protein [Coprobacillus cateniformis]RGO08860.1 hypothetical protein DXB30_17115 [Coprobacillus cateniformis]RGO18159.1 hypothetical protein DXB26_17240 [Coprobacillus cateniformis]
MIDLTQVLTFSEAAEKWGLANGNTLRKAVERKRFHSDEIRKSGDVWLTTYQAMLRVFGQPRQSEIIISMEQMYQLVSKIIYKDGKAQKELQTIFDKIDETIINHKTVTVIASSQQPESIIMIIKSENDVEVLKKRVERYISSISV